MAAKTETKSTQEMIEERDKLFADLKENLTALQTQRDFHSEQVLAIDEQISEFRGMLPEGDDEPAATPTKRSYIKRATSNGTRRGRGSNDALMSDMVLAAVKKSGRAGLSKREIAKALLDAGYETPTVANIKKPTEAEIEKFCKSVYVSGIYKLKDGGKLEHFRMEDGGREGRYRIPK